MLLFRMYGVGETSGEHVDEAKENRELKKKKTQKSRAK